MANTKKPTDVTGQAHADLQKQQLEAQAQAAADAAAAQAQENARLESDIVDATKKPQPTVIVDEVVTVGSPKENLPSQPHQQ